MVVLKTGAKNVDFSFLGAKDFFGCMYVWGLNPEWVRRLRGTRHATNRETVRKIMAVCCGKLAEDVKAVGSHKPGGVCTDRTGMADVRHCLKNTITSHYTEICRLPLI